jgi:ureidoglycolate lyase
MPVLTIELLTVEGFVPFGEVIEKAGVGGFPTNDGAAMRYHGLGTVDCAEEQGKPLLSIFSVPHPTFSEQLTILERHPISSQAFVPLGRVRAVFVVAPRDASPGAGNIRAFISDGVQGVNYARGTWHAPLITLEAGDFLVVDRSGPGPGFDQDYDEVDVRGLELRLPPTK